MKITEDVFKTGKQLLGRGVTYKEVGRILGCGQTTVYNIRRNNTFEEYVAYVNSISARAESNKKRKFSRSPSVTKDTWELVNNLTNVGVSVKEIMRITGLSGTSVRKLSHHSWEDYTAENETKKEVTRVKRLEANQSSAFTIAKPASVVSTVPHAEPSASDFNPAPDTTALRDLKTAVERLETKINGLISESQEMRKDYEWVMNNAVIDGKKRKWF